MESKLGMKFKMKYSGIEWIGDIPENWELNRLKEVIDINSESLSENTNPDITIKYVDITAVEQTGLVKEPVELFFRDAPSRARRIIKNGDTIVSTVRPYLQAIAFFGKVEPNLIVSTGFATLSPKSGIEPKFVYYYVISHLFLSYMVSNSVGVSYPAVGQKAISVIPFLKPPENEQKKIILYLDRVNSKLQKIIDFKYNQIELLYEYEKSVISRSVTRNIEQESKMINSGVDWIGEIPEHYLIKRLKEVASFISRGETPDYSEEDTFINVLNQACIYNDLIDYSKAKHNIIKNISDSKGILKKYDVLITSTGTGTVGRVNIFEEDSCYLADTHITIIRDEFKRFEPRYIYYFLFPYRHLIENYLSQGATNQIELQSRNIKEFKIPFPKKSIQIEISNFLDSETKKIRKIIGILKEEIIKLEEYRKSLIYEAVTGKIRLS